MKKQIIEKINKLEDNRKLRIIFYFIKGLLKE